MSETHSRSGSRPKLPVVRPVWFLLGTHEPHWLSRTSVPLFLSRRRLMERKGALPRAQGLWALDSGGFSELDLFGRWVTPPKVYVTQLRDWVAQAGGHLLWAAIQDWMCEDKILRKTGKTIRVHQRKTIESWFTLNALAPELPWAPVLQGREPEDYLRHADAYEAAGVDLRRAPIVGVGTMCRRQRIKGAALEILRGLRARGYTLHGFGLKITGLKQLALADALTGYPTLESADSLAWSTHARHVPPLPDHGPGKRGLMTLFRVLKKDSVAKEDAFRLGALGVTVGLGRLDRGTRDALAVFLDALRQQPGHANCANCLEFALQWRETLLAKLATILRTPVRALLSGLEGPVGCPNCGAQELTGGYEPICAECGWEAPVEWRDRAANPPEAWRPQLWYPDPFLGDGCEACWREGDDA